MEPGAEFSLIPRHPSNLLAARAETLRAANGEDIQTYGHRSLQNRSGLNRKLCWVLLVAGVTHPFIVIDFLHHLDLLVAAGTGK